MDSLSLHRGGWRDARVVLQALFAELAVYLNRAGGWAAQAPTTDLRTPPPTSRSPTRTKQPICRCNNIPRHFLRPTMIEFALLFTCFRKLGPGFRKPSAGPVDSCISFATRRRAPALLQGQCPVDEDLRSKTRSACRSRNLVSSKILDLLLRPGITPLPLT